jgi:hypothetical protein
MLTCRRLSRLLVTLVLFAPASTSLGLPSSLRADEPAAPADPIKDRLETARETYQSKITDSEEAADADA